MTNTQAKNPELYGIQMLRAVAALAVVIHHTLEQSNGAIGRFSPDWLTTAGASGVDIFFVISGFIMLHVSFRAGKPPTPGNFLFRRATRIYPIYWVCCFAMLFISALGFLSSHHNGPLKVLNSFLLLPGDKLIGVSWTLVYEVYFYILFAITLIFRSARIAIIGTTAAIIALCSLSATFPQGDAANFLADPLPIEFCFGLGLAYAYSTQMRRAGGWPVRLPVAVIGLGLLMIAPMFVEHPSTNGLPAWPRVAAWGIPAALTVACFLNVGKPVNSFTKSCVVLGDASYALYLTHVFVMIGYGRLLKVNVVSRLPQLPVAVVIVTVAVMVAVLVHLLVEKPALKLIRRLTRRQPGHATPA